MQKNLLYFKDAGIVALYVAVVVVALWLVSLIGIHVFSSIYSTRNPPPVIVISGEGAELHMLDATLRHLRAQHSLAIGQALVTSSPAGRDRFLQEADVLAQRIEDILRLHFGQALCKCY